MKSKYVILELADTPGLPLAVLLPARIEHKAAALMGQPISAGWVEFTPDGPVVSGSSYSLKLKARPQDAEIISLWHKFPTGAGLSLPPVL